MAAVVRRLFRNAALGGGLLFWGFTVAQAGEQTASASRATGPAAKPLTDAVSLGRGKALYEGTKGLCANCHGPELGGLIGPNLTDDFWLDGCSLADVTRAIQVAFPARGMMPFGTGVAMSAEEVHLLASYVMSKRGTKPANPKAVDPTREKPCK